MSLNHFCNCFSFRYFVEFLYIVACIPQVLDSEIRQRVVSNNFQWQVLVLFLRTLFDFQLFSLVDLIFSKKTRIGFLLSCFRKIIFHQIHEDTPCTFFVFWFLFYKVFAYIFFFSFLQRWYAFKILNCRQIVWNFTLFFV